MLSVDRFLPVARVMKAKQQTGTHTTRLGSRMAKVAGDDRDGDVSWMVCIQICG